MLNNNLMKGKRVVALIDALVRIKFAKKSYVRDRINILSS